MIRAWTPETWAAYCEANPTRRFKSDRDQALIRQMLPGIERATVLEAGCGYGRLTPAFRGAARLVLLDREPAMLGANRARGAAAAGAVSGDLGRLPVRAGRFDIVACVGVLMHVERPLRAIDELAAAVKPGGRLLITWNNRRSPWAPLLEAFSRRPGALRQRFLGTDEVEQALRRNGFCPLQLRADSILPLTAAFGGGRRALFPATFARALDRLERWGLWRRLLTALGYELFVVAQKETPAC